MDSFGLDNSMLIGLQLEQLSKQFKNACTRLNINTNFEKPIKHWLIENIRGRFKTRNAKTGFKIDYITRINVCRLNVIVNKLRNNLILPFLYLITPQTVESSHVLL